MNFKFHSQLVLLVAKLTEEHFLNFFDLTLNFQLSSSNDLDVHKVQEAGSTKPPGNKNCRKVSQDLPMLGASK